MMGAENDGGATTELLGPAAEEDVSCLMVARGKIGSSLLLSVIDRAL